MCPKLEGLRGPHEHFPYRFLFSRFVTSFVFWFFLDLKKRNKVKNGASGDWNCPVVGNLSFPAGHTEAGGQELGLSQAWAFAPRGMLFFLPAPLSHPSSLPPEWPSGHRPPCCSLLGLGLVLQELPCWSPPKCEQLGCEASKVAGLSGRQADCGVVGETQEAGSESWAEPWADTRVRFSDATPHVFPLSGRFFTKCLAFLLPPNLPWPPSATLSPAVVPGQAFWRSLLCPWHTKL